MAEFSELVRTKKRICAKHKSNNCMGCPIPDLCGIISISSYADIEFQKLEDALMSWAAENPEPVYPTWYEWLIDQAVMVAGERGCYGNILPTNKIFTPIPADTAQKLGVEPKKG